MPTSRPAMRLPPLILLRAERNGAGRADERPDILAHGPARSLTRCGCNALVRAFSQEDRTGLATGDCSHGCNISCDTACVPASPCFVVCLAPSNSGLPRVAVLNR
jgi:hypothetical protein